MLLVLPLVTVVLVSVATGRPVLPALGLQPLMEVLAQPEPAERPALTG
jgi:hypothetical protein